MKSTVKIAFPSICSFECFITGIYVWIEPDVKVEKELSELKVLRRVLRIFDMHVEVSTYR